jgi:hypothetical protein
MIIIFIVTDIIRVIIGIAVAVSVFITIIILYFVKIIVSGRCFKPNSAVIKYSV